MKKGVFYWGAGLLMAALAMGTGACTEQKEVKVYPKLIQVKPTKTSHVQGIAVDREKGFVYISFTTKLIKTDLQGNIIGSVKGLLGHLGCLEFNSEDGRVYGSLEYKNDKIGRGILAVNNKADLQWSNGFYIAIFDVDKIDRMEMDAEKDEVMTSVYLPTVLEDYMGQVELDGKTLEHRLCCSGIDGVSFGPKFGKTDGQQYLTVAYGIYRDLERTDNDYQVLLQYDTRNWKQYEHALSQHELHQKGPAMPDGKYYAFTGNTTYGVQNLEYDEVNKIWLMAVYRGRKPEYPNYGLYAIDAKAQPEMKPLKGVWYEKEGMVVELAKLGTRHAQSGVYGWDQDMGATGLESLGNGQFYTSEVVRQEDLNGAEVKLYDFDPNQAEPFTLAE